MVSSCSPPTEDPVWCVPRYRRGHGGVAVLYRKSLSHKTSKLITPLSHRIVGVKFSFSLRPICIISVYLPSRSGCTDEFRESLDCLDSIISLHSIDSDIVILGDLNADPGFAGGPFARTNVNEQGKILLSYLNRWSFVSTHLHLNSRTPSHTYESEAHGSVSTIDHILCPSYLLPSFRKSVVLEESALNTSDHLPLSCGLSIHSSVQPPNNVESGSRPIALNLHPINWKKIDSDDVLTKYSDPLDASISHLTHLTVDDLSDPICIDQTLSTLISKMKFVSNNLPRKRFLKHVVPGWNDSLKKAHNAAKSAYRAWSSAGKPRSPDNQLRSSYKQHKRVFRRLLRSHKQKLKEEFFNNLDFSNTDSSKLFRTIKQFYGSNSQSHSNSIVWNNKVYKNDDLLEGWADYFSSLCTPHSVETFDSEFYNKTNSVFKELLGSSPGSPFTFLQDDVEVAIKSLKLDKAAGADGIDPEHLVFAGPLFAKCLTVVFNAIILSCHLPPILCLGHIHPIPKGVHKNLQDPSNYRGITILSNIAKVFEKLLLSKINDDGIQLNPLQGGFRTGYSSLHSAFLLQEAICSTREHKSKAFVAFLDAKKAFDTVWHQGLFVKLHEKGIDKRIWHILWNWYSNSSSSVVIDSSYSSPFPILQGVRQGAILSPLLYSIFVDELLDDLTSSKLGVMIGSVHCPSPMYADDLALIANSAERLQLLLDIVYRYSSKWRYQFNSAKSAILVFGESTKSRLSARCNRAWHVGPDTIQEQDSYIHLGILRSVSNSNSSRTASRCASGRSAFFALNSIGSRFGCLHPSTSFRLYSSLCLPILLYGAELWVPSKSDLIMISRVHRKILRTIQGLPTRCPSVALTSLIGSLDIDLLLFQKQLSFMNTFSTFTSMDLPRQVLDARLSSPSRTGVISQWERTLSDLKLPSLPVLLSSNISKLSWKSSTKKLLLIKQHVNLMDSCEKYPVSSLSLKLGKPSLVWTCTRKTRSLTPAANFRIRLLTGCDGLEGDAARFRYRNCNLPQGDPSCKICDLQEREDHSHFLIRCAALNPLRTQLLGSAPPNFRALLPDISSNPSDLLDVLLGIDWIENMELQHWILAFINQLKQLRNELIIS